MANFVDFTPLRNLFRERQSTEVRTPHPARTHAAGAAHRGTRLSAAHTITMSLFYQTISLLCEGGILKALVTLPRGVELRIGTPVRDYFEAPWNAYFTGTITKLPATNAGVWEVTFSDGNKLDYDTEPEIRQVLDVTKMEQWQPLEPCHQTQGGDKIPFSCIENSPNTVL